MAQLTQIKKAGPSNPLVAASDAREAQDAAQEQKPTTPGSKFFEFEYSKAYASRLISNWKEVCDTVKKNRDARTAVPDVEKMRAEGKLPEGHTYVGVKLIDTNIQAAMPAHLMYLKQSRRLGIFQPTDIRLARQAVNDLDTLESEFTRVLQYPGWETDYIKLLDASGLNGRGWLEVENDVSKPGHVAINFVNVDCLMHDEGITDLQSSRMVMRAHTVTAVSLQLLASVHGFDATVVEQLLTKLEQSRERDVRVYSPESQLKVYRIFFKDDTGRVNEGWIEKDSTTWLKAPVAFHNGISTRTYNEVGTTTGPDGSPTMSVESVPTDAPEHQTIYPYFKKLLRITEDDVLTRTKGRADLDYYKQDACSATLSSFVNGCLDGSNTMWSPDKPNLDGASGEPKQTTLKIQNGRVWDQPMRPLNAPYPGAELLIALDKISTLNQTETAQISWAVNNRKDSRKTAREIDESSQQQTIMSGVEVLMFSLTLTDVLNYAWKIVRSAALRGLIKFAPLPNGENNAKLIEREYTIKPAGDIDFIERSQLVAKMQQDWPVMQQTPLRDAFLEDYVRVRYPEYADRYIALLRQGNVTAVLAQLLQRAMNIAFQAITDEKGAVQPEWQQYLPQLQQMQQQAMQAIAQASATAPGAPQAAQAQQPVQ